MVWMPPPPRWWWWVESLLLVNDDARVIFLGGHVIGIKLTKVEDFWIERRNLRRAKRDLP